MGPKGFAAVEKLARRAREQRGGNEPRLDHFDRSAPDALALWHDAYLESLASRNYSLGTLGGRRDALKLFLSWAAERDLHRAGQITRPILDSFQRRLWRYTRPNGQRLGWSTQRNRLSILKDFFRWVTRQNVILHNPASELELPRPEKRLPQEVLSLAAVEKLMAIPDVSDPLGVRDRTMLELFYSTGLRRTELCRLELADLNTDRRTLHVRLGKGKKDRMVPVGQRTGRLRDAVVHRSRHIDDCRHPAYFPPRTRVEDTVLDLAQVSANFDEAFDWLCRAVGRGPTTTELVRSALARRPRHRWRADIEAALDDVADGARSVLERRYITGVERRHGLPQAHRQARTVINGKTRYVDNLYEEASLAVELDGSASHPPEQRWADSRRDNAHAGLGILTVRYNWADVTQRPCFVAAQVAGLLRARAPGSTRPRAPRTAAAGLVAPRHTCTP